jgi:outer membrane protein OmpA-like peptidoglycan-associated protein
MVELVDQGLSKHWAIAPIVSGGAVLTYCVFVLTNRETGREHQLHVGGAGLQTPGVSTAGGPPSYSLFETDIPVNFEAFNGVGARITSANIGVFYGYSIVYLRIWKGEAYASDGMAYVRMTGGSFMVMPAGSVVHGVTVLTYGSGSRLGTVPLLLTPSPEEEFAPRAWVKYQIIPKLPRGAILPDDVLFDFDKDTINPHAKRTLLFVADLLNNRSKLGVRIEGHTDSIGSTSYNMDLSLRRARAVQRWLVEHKVYKARDFMVIGHGEYRPVAPNQWSNRIDNPEGRRRNRRVEIIFE